MPMHAGPSADARGPEIEGQTLEALLRTGGAGLHSDYAWIELDQHEAPLILALHGDAQPVPDVRGIAQHARASGGRLMIGDLRGDAAGAAARIGPTLGAVLAEPIHVGGRVAGTIGVADTRPRYWSAHDTVLLSALAAAAEALVQLDAVQQAVAEQARTARVLRAQNSAIRTLADAASVEEALPRVLMDVAPILGFNAGACWLPNNTAAPMLRCRAFWSDLGSATADFEIATRNAALASGVGLPGEVWEQGRSVWIDRLDSADPATIQRLSAARAAGFQVACAFPIVAAREVAGVIELYAAKPLPYSQELREHLEALGTHVGAFIQRKRTEAALVESEARFRILSETASDPIFTMDETSTILYVNPAVERVFGYTPEQLIGKSMTVLIPESMRARHREGVRHHAATGERRIPWSGVQLPGLHADGREVPLEISFGEYSHRGVHMYTGIARDISERVTQQHAVEQQAEQLAELASELERTIEELEEQRDEALHAREEADRSNRAKSNFLAIMSHELRTPLNAIMGYTDLLDAGIPEPIAPGPRQKIARIAFSARHLLALIDEVLMYSRLEAGGETPRVETFALRSLLDDVSGIIEPLATAKGLQFERVAPAEPGTLDSDVHKIRQILINLLGNAVKFTEYGRVRLCVEREEGYVVFHVEDTGIGIRTDDLDAIFTAFWQAGRATTRSVGGTGLGLSVTRHLARLLGGDVTVQSTPGTGSTFTVRLPPLIRTTAAPH